MIDVYYWPTPNGHKITMILEELQVPYQIKLVNIGEGEQNAHDYLKLSPNGRIPAIVDHDPEGNGGPLALFESGAILLYLAKKYSKLIPVGVRAEANVLQWLFWQVGGLGPMAGQLVHFKLYAPDRIEYATSRYLQETVRLYGVLDRQLAKYAYLAGEDYSIADIASFPWAVGHYYADIDIGGLTNLQRWLDTIKTRPATERAFAIGQSAAPPPASPADQ